MEGGIPFALTATGETIPASVYSSGINGCVTNSESAKVSGEGSVLPADGDCDECGSSGAREQTSFLGSIELRRCASVLGDEGPSGGREWIASTGTSTIGSSCGENETHSVSLELMTGRSLR